MWRFEPINDESMPSGGLLAVTRCQPCRAPEGLFAAIEKDRRWTGTAKADPGRCAWRSTKAPRRGASARRRRDGGGGRWPTRRQRRRWKDRQTGHGLSQVMSSPPQPRRSECFGARRTEPSRCGFVEAESAGKLGRVLRLMQGRDEIMRPNRQPSPERQIAARRSAAGGFRRGPQATARSLAGRMRSAHRRTAASLIEGHRRFKDTFLFRLRVHLRSHVGGGNTRFITSVFV